jgi:hypothetical protein
MSICQYCLCGRAGREAALRVAAVALLLVPGALGVLAGAKEEAVGPRGEVGPDVPLSEAEKARFARRVRAAERTAAAVQAACDRAVKEGAGVVLLPAGEYVFDAAVRVPGGLTILGEGAASLVRTAGRDTRLFEAAGDRGRFARLRLQGADATPGTENDTYGISVAGKRNVRIDHCELSGFSYATNFADEASAQVDHCRIHHNLRDGLGYGVALYSGAHVLVTDNEFSQNRHSLASNGALDWSSPKKVGKYVHKPGVRKTHWEFIRNRVSGDDKTANRLCAVDTHPGMDGTFVVEANLFESIRHGVGIRDGAGLIRGNVFRNLAGYRPVAITIGYGTHNNIPVEGTMPHDIQVADNVFENAGDRVFAGGILAESAEHAAPAKYRLGRAENITIEGRLVPATQKDRGVPPPIPRLKEMGEDGVLGYREGAPAK